MKLVKLSLAAALAAGALATTASAAPFEEVIKDVDVSGYTRVRYTHDRQPKVKTNTGKWNYKAILNFKTKIDDNFFGVISLRYDSTDVGAQSSLPAPGQPSLHMSRTGNHDSNIEVNQAYLGYNVGNTTVLVGRQTVGAFFTDDMVGSGVKVLNTDIEGLTLAALWMDSLEQDPNIGTMALPAVKGKTVIDHNLYGVAAIGSYDPVSFQLWYASLADVANLFAVQLGADVAVADDINLGLKGQYAFTKLSSDYKDLVGGDNSNFYAVEVSTNISMFDLSAGYLNFSTKKDRASLTSFEDNGAFIAPGEELLDYSAYYGKNKYWFVAAGVTLNDQVRLGLDYVDGENKVEGLKTDRSEWVARADYAYSKKLKFKTWYSQVREEEKVDNGNKKRSDRIRFEAKYSF